MRKALSLLSLFILISSCSLALSGDTYGDASITDGVLELNGGRFVSSTVSGYQSFEINSSEGLEFKVQSSSNGFKDIQDSYSFTAVEGVNVYPLNVDQDGQIRYVVEGGNGSVYNVSFRDGSVTPPDLGFVKYDRKEVSFKIFKEGDGFSKVFFVPALSSLRPVLELGLAVVAGLSAGILVRRHKKKRKRKKLRSVGLLD
jgi:hypothetical protein